MIDVVGSIKITNELRFKYLLATIKSYEFIANHCTFVLNVEGITKEQNAILHEYLKAFDFTRIHLTENEPYGIGYCKLLNECKKNYVINFMEDHFMVLNDSVWLLQLLHLMNQNKVDVCKSSFNKIELNSAQTISGEKTTYGLIYRNNESNFIEYKKHYKSRYYLGVNFITTKDFAKYFWNRNLGKRPHEYEIVNYQKDFEHTCLIPYKEIQCAIDDSHGEPGTCLIERNETKYDSIIQHIKL